MAAIKFHTFHSTTIVLTFKAGKVKLMPLKTTRTEFYCSSKVYIYTK